jgi:hypothetical protein
MKCFEVETKKCGEMNAPDTVVPQMKKKIWRAFF